MFDAGTALFTLTGHVVSEPFDRYGRLVETARTQKEHAIVLGAKTVASGFEQFQGWLDRTKQGVRDFAATTKGAFDSVGATTNRMTMAADRDLKVMRDSLGKTAESSTVLGESTKKAAGMVVGEQGRMVRSTVRTADEYKASADSIARSNAKIAESSRMAAGGGGRGPGGVAAVGGGGAHGDPVAQTKRQTAAWKEGAGTLANLGKWTTIAGGAIGILTMKWAADFQRQMELVHTQAGYSERDVHNLTKAVRDLAPAVGIGPTKLAQGLFHIASSGIPAAHAMEVLKVAAEGAKVGNSDLEHTTNALVAILRTAPKDVHGVAEAMGVMNDIVGHGNLRMEDLTAAMTTGILPAAKGVGLGLRDVGAALDVLTSRGTPAEQASTRLRTTLSLIHNPTAKAQKALMELGFSQGQLADDMEKHGLVFALQDLQNHLQAAFGHKLDTHEEEQALTAYAEKLKATGASAGTIRKDLIAYKISLEETGSASGKASQLIAQAFGGARMGTTMVTLMQNLTDLRKHTEDLNKAGAAQRFQDAWKATQKDFSVQVSQMAAGVQKLGIELGDFLIPKVKDVVKWLIQAAKWLGHHKQLADALAIAFGVILAGAVVAFFGKLVLKAAEGGKAIGQVAAGVWKIPDALRGATTKVVGYLDEQEAKLRAVQEQAAATADALAGEGAGMTAGGPGGVVEEAAGGGGGLGAIEGMITGVKGTAAPGSSMNPLAVVIMASRSFGLSQGAAAEAESTAAAGPAAGGVSGRTQPMTSRGGVIIPPGQTAREIEEAEAAGGRTAAEEIQAAHVQGAREAASEIEGGMVAGGRAAAGEIAAGEAAGGTTAAGEMGLVGRLRGRAASAGASVAGAASTATTIMGELGSRLLRGGMGVLIAQTLGDTIKGGIGHAIKDIGTGAALGSIFGPWGTALGGALGLAVTLFIGHSKSDGEKWVDSFTSTLPGKISDRTKEGLKKAGDLPAQPSPSTPTGPGGRPRPGAVSPIPSVDVAAGQVTRARLAERIRPSAENQKELDRALELYRHEFNTQFNAMFNQAFVYGQKAGNSWVEGMSQVKFPTEFSVLHSMEAVLNNVPKNVRKSGREAVKVWQDEAAKQMIEYTATLERNKKLPQGATDRLIHTLEGQYKGLREYLNKQGEGSAKDIAFHFQFKGAQHNLSNAVNDFRKEWGLQWQFGITTTKNSTDHLRTLMGDLSLWMHSNDKGTRERATAEWHKLHGMMSDVLGAMLADTISKTGDIKQAVSTNTHQAYRIGSDNFKKLQNDIAFYMASGATATAKGLKNLTDEVNAALKSFGEKPLAAVTVKSLTPGQLAAVATGQVSSGAAASRHATGGVLPGSEFGMGDAMTLVDPMGRPRARMAGDENVFTRHQMPYVEAGLHMLGFGGAQDLWNRVNTPHGIGLGFNRGGRIRRLAGGGIVTASEFGGPGDPGTGSQGYRGDNLYSHPDSFAELNMGTALGNLPYLAPIDVTYRGKTARLFKRDIGAGGPGVGGHTRAVDLWFQAAQALGFTGLDNVLVNGPSGVNVKISGGGGGGGAPQFIAPKVEGRGFMADIVRKSLSKTVAAANSYILTRMPVSTGGGFGVSGPKGLGTFDGHQVADWIIPVLNWARQHGWTGSVTSGYRPGYDPHAVGGHSEHALTQYPGGAIDVGGPAAIAEGTNLYDVLKGYHGPRNLLWGGIYIQGYSGPGGHDYGHFSGTGHARGGRLPGFQGGGRLPGFQGGGRPYAPLPSGVGHYPGYRPVRVRRGTGGLHTVGGSHGRRGAHAGSRGSAGGGGGRTQARKRQPISQQVADTLKKMGFGAFADYQTELGNLDQQYTEQEGLFQLYDPNGMTQSELNTLMGIREKEWDILHREFKTLPGAINKITNRVKKLTGSSGHPAFTTPSRHGRHEPHPPHGAGRLQPGTGITDPLHSRVHHHAVLPSGVEGLKKDVSDTEDDITSLEYQNMRATQSIATIHHDVSAEIFAATDQYARELTGFIKYLQSAHEQLYKNSQRRISLHARLRSLPKPKKAPPSISSIVSGVMGGTDPATTGGSVPDPARNHIEDQLAALQRADLKIQDNAYQVRQSMHSLLVDRENQARAYRERGFNEAWAYQLKKFKIQDEIFKLKQILKKLKASLSDETAELNKEQKVLDTLTGWETGGLEGGQSVADSLESIAFDLLDLRQQGASLPTPGRKHPTLKDVEHLITRPKAPVPWRPGDWGLGLKLPSGLTQGTAAATQALTDFATFQASRAALFSQFGSNFAPAGSGVGASSAAIGAGPQFFGAAAGSSAGAGAPGPGFAGGGRLSSPGAGGTTINIENHFAAGPPDPHTWSAGTAHELNAMA